MYVTLEPCCHYGKTSPCTSVIINSKISEVIYSIKDVDKRVNGKSKKILSLNKIQVKTGLLKNQVSEFYSSYFYNRKYKLPYVTGKIAISKNNLIYSKGTCREVHLVVAGWRRIFGTAPPLLSSLLERWCFRYWYSMMILRP